MLNSLPICLVVGTVLGFLTGLGIGGGSLLMLWLTLVLGVSQADLIYELPAEGGIPGRGTADQPAFLSSFRADQLLDAQKAGHAELENQPSRHDLRLCRRWPWQLACRKS